MHAATVEILPRGRSGVARYDEGDGRVHEFYWELGGGDVVAWVSVPAAADWPAAVPWAADRREQVLARLAAELCRQRCAGCRIRISSTGVELLAPAHQEHEQAG